MVAVAKRGVRLRDATKAANGDNTVSGSFYAPRARRRQRIAHGATEGASRRRDRDACKE